MRAALLNILVVGGVGALITFGGSLAVTGIFRLVDRRARRHAAEETPGQPEQQPEPPEESVQRAGEVLRGGHWIGVLERACIFATILAGWPEGVAVVIAIKGLGRYGELRSSDQPTAERFMIGSLASVLTAGCGALLARWLLTLA